MRQTEESGVWGLGEFMRWWLKVCPLPLLAQMSVSWAWANANKDNAIPGFSSGGHNEQGSRGRSLVLAERFS
jgi:hypothetical protein